MEASSSDPTNSTSNVTISAVNELVNVPSHSRSEDRVYTKKKELLSLEIQLEKLKRKNAKRKRDKRAKKRKRRDTSSSDDNDVSDRSHSNDKSPVKISLLNVASAYDKPLSPLILRKVPDEQPCTANTLQPSTANSAGSETHITEQRSSAATDMNPGHVSPAVDFVASAGPTIGDTVSLLPTDDNLTEEDVEQNVIVGTNFEGVDLPYKSDPYGPPVDNALGDALCTIWNKKYVYHEMKPVWDKYPLPSNLGDNIQPPEMNSEVFKLLQKWQQNYDTKWFRIQKALTKCVSATVHLNDVIANSEIDKTDKTGALQTTVDMTQMLSQVNTEISIKRRGFAKTHLANEYKDLCDRDRPITKFLFGDKIAEDIKQINVTKQLAKPKFEQKSSNSFLYRGRGRNKQYQRAPQSTTNRYANHKYQNNQSKKTYKK